MARNLLFPGATPLLTMGVLVHNRKRRALLVDDEPALRNMVSRHFARLGFDTVECDSGEAAWPHVETSRFDVVVTDVHLPGISGLDFARRLSASQPWCPVVIITGDAEALRAPEAAACLLKPFDLAELDAAVGVAISRGEILSMMSHRGTREGDGVTEGALLSTADEHSGADLGHGYRTSLYARHIACRLSPGLSPQCLDDLDTAARHHEIGVLLAPLGSGATQAACGAALLRSRGGAEGAVELLRLMGAPLDELAELPRPLRLLAVALRLADELDHEVAATDCENPTAALRRALAALERRLEEFGFDAAGVSDSLALVRHFASAPRDPRLLSA